MFSSPNIIRVMKSTSVKWLGHVARVGDSRNACRIVAEELAGKRTLGRPVHRWEDVIKMDLRKRVCAVQIRFV